MTLVLRLLLPLIHAAGFIKIAEWLFAGVTGAAEVTATQVTEKVAKMATKTVQNALSQATAGITPPYTENAPSGAEPPKPSMADTMVDRLTNPWLWGAVGVAALFGTTAIRQTRGLGRDIGSGVKNTRSAFKEDLGELQSEPD